MEVTSAAKGVWPIIGHDTAVDQLRRAVHSSRVHHAYLFTGPDGVGRRTLALTFAQALVCVSPLDERPCRLCSICRRVQDGIFPDVTILDLESQQANERRESKNTVISIETVRGLRSSVSLRPMESAWRVAILEDVDRLSRDAYDALLKTLEEPPPFVVLLLIAREYEALPETIRSRCRHISLEPLPRNTVAAELEKRGSDPERARLVAQLTRGRIGRAIDLIADKDSLQERNARLGVALEMIQDPLSALAEARRMADQYRRGQREQIHSEIDLLIGLWRDVLLCSVGHDNDVANFDVLDQLRDAASRWRLNQIETALEACYQALHDLNVNVQARLALTTMVMQWPEPR